MVSPADIQEALRHKGWVLEQSNFPTGRPDRSAIALRMPDGTRAVAKPYPSGDGEVVYASMQELWRSSFGERRQPPGLPKPIEYLPDVGALVMERLPGRPLVELDAMDDDMLQNSVRLVASLHESDARPGKQRPFRRILRSVQRKAGRMAELAPEFAPAFQEVVDALERANVPDGELVPCHGDCSPRNVLVAPGRSVLIDWDRFQLADPARDIAYFGTWCWAWALRQKRQPDWSVLGRAIAIYESARPAVSLKGHLPYHVAASLLRIAHGLVELWPQDAHLVPNLTAEALHQLRKD